MKKSYIIVALLLLAVAALPVVGNKYIKSTIDDKVAQLHSYGLEIKEDKSNSSYLNTSRHFEFYLQNSDQFISYLNNYADNQIPPFVNALLNGLTLGVDVKYSNIPFTKSQTMEIYPLALSPEVADSIKKNNPDFYSYLEKFFQEKGILYHIDYNLINQEFTGYIKDIDENYTLKNDAKLKLVIKSVKFNGKGELLAPSRLQTQAKVMHFSVVEPHEKLELELSGLNTSNNFDSANTYVSSAKIKELSLIMEAVNDSVNAELTNLQFNASSNGQGSDLELHSKTSLDSMKLTSKNVTFDVSSFNIDAALSGIDKTLFEKLRTLKDSSQASAVTAALLSKGLSLNIADFSVKNLNTKRFGSLKGFQLKSTVDFKADPDLMKKLQKSPMLLLSNLSMKTNLQLSKEIFTLLTQGNPFAAKLESYAKEQNGNYKFDINFINSQMTINGKLLQ